MAHLLAILVGLSGFILYMAAFFFPEVHRKNDFIWSGIIFFYALALWVYSGRITGGVLLGQVASVVVLGWLGWQTLAMRRQLTPYDQQTWVSGSGKSLGDVLFLNATQLGSQFKQRWEQLPLPAPLKGLPDQVGRTVGNLQTKPQPKMAPQAPVKTAEGTPAEPRKVRKKPKATPETPAEVSETAPTSATSSDVTPETGKAASQAEALAKTAPPSDSTPVVEGTEAVTAIAPPPESSLAEETDALQSTSGAAIAPTPEAPSVEETESNASLQSPPEAIAPPAQPGVTTEALTGEPPVTEPATPVAQPSASAEKSVPASGIAVPEATSASADTFRQPAEPDTAANIPFTPPPGTEPTAVAHISEVIPTAPEASVEATTPMEIVPPPDQQESPPELSYVADTETMVPPLDTSTDTPELSDIASLTPISTEPAATNPEDVVADGLDTEIQIDDVTPFNETSAPEQPKVSQETESFLPSPKQNESESEWESMTQDLWGGAAPVVSMEDERDSPQDHTADQADADAAVPESAPTTNGLNLSMPDISESLHEEDWGEEDTEEPQSQRADDWDMDWNEPPEEPTPIQPPPVQPIIEPGDLTFADMVAAANRTLTPEDRVVVDVKAVAITDEESTPPTDNWDDWDEEDNDAWFDR